jgi:type IV pilus assembly protein PilM
VITNGFRVWQRNIPLGGNHFTKQLTKELKLTFAKAEHLKRNVREAEDAKAVVQAMRPVFNDLLTEVQRSIGFFQNIDRRAQINGIIMLGNAIKLPGLQQYLAKNLGYQLVDLDQAAWSARLTGPSVLSAPQFKENMHAYGLCYGLCLQGLGQAKLNTNLLPKEIVTQRLIRSKKPWVVATAGALMLAFAVNFFFEYNEWYRVHPGMKRGDLTWEQAISEVSGVQTLSSQYDQEDRQRVQRLEELVALGNELSGDSDRRLLWLELLKASNRALPRTEGVAPTEIPDPKVVPISQRKELNIEYIESQYISDLSMWFSEPVRKKFMEEMARREGIITSLAEQPTDAEPPPAAPDEAAAAANAENGGVEATAGEVPDDLFEPEVDIELDSLGLPEVTGPEGPGWVIELGGHHFHNEDPMTWGGTHVRDTLLKNLREMTIELPAGPGREAETFTMEELGIGYAILAVERRIIHNHTIPNPYYEPPAGRGRPGTMGPGGVAPGAAGGLGGGLGRSTRGGLTTRPTTAKPTTAKPTTAKPTTAQPGAEASDNGDQTDNPPFFLAPKYDFVVQFCWQERLLNERLRAREQAMLQQMQDDLDDADDLTASEAVTPPGD